MAAVGPCATGSTVLLEVTLDTPPPCRRATSTPLARTFVAPRHHPPSPGHSPVRVQREAPTIELSQTPPPLSTSPSTRPSLPLPPPPQSTPPRPSPVGSPPPQTSPPRPDLAESAPGTPTDEFRLSLSPAERALVETGSLGPGPLLQRSTRPRLQLPAAGAPFAETPVHRLRPRRPAPSLVRDLREFLDFRTSRRPPTPSEAETTVKSADSSTSSVD